MPVLYSGNATLLVASAQALTRRLRWRDEAPGAGAAAGRTVLIGKACANVVEIESAEGEAGQDRLALDRVEVHSTHSARLDEVDNCLGHLGRPIEQTLSSTGRPHAGDAVPDRDLILSEARAYLAILERDLRQREWKNLLYRAWSSWASTTKLRVLWCDTQCDTRNVISWKFGAQCSSRHGEQVGRSLAAWEEQEGTRNEGAGGHSR